MKLSQNIVIAAALCVLPSFSIAQAAPFKIFVAKSETELGKWGANWWFWALSAPEGHDPISDTTGKDCAVNQQGNVWFLAGTYEDGDPVKRSCSIPAGKTVLFPLINMYTLAGRQALCNDDAKKVSTLFDGAKIDYLEIDGQNINAAHTRGKVACFYLPAQRRWLSVDGYWAIVEFKKGKHTISFKATTSEFAQNITYTLIQK